MVGFPAKPAKTVVEERAVQVADQEVKVKTFKDALDFPSIDSFLDFDSVNWSMSNRNIEEFSIEDTDFDYFEDKMEMGLTGTCSENQSIEVKPELGGDFSGEVVPSSIGSDSMIEEKPVLCDAMSEEIGLSSVISEPKLCDDMSSNLESGAESVKGPEPVVSDNCKPIEGETASVGCPTMNLDESEFKKTDKSLASSIEVGLEKVSLTMDDDETTAGANLKIDSAVSESETSSSSSGSSDSSSSEEEESDEEDSDEEEKKKEQKFEDQRLPGKADDVAGELEEGEIESVDGGEDDEGEDDEGEDDEGEDDDDDEVNDKRLKEK